MKVYEILTESYGGDGEGMVMEVNLESKWIGFSHCSYQLFGNMGSPRPLPSLLVQVQQVTGQIISLKIVLTSFLLEFAFGA